jgi:hypothetical protein
MAEWSADLLYSVVPQAAIEGRAVAAASIVSEKSRWPPIPATVFDRWAAHSAVGGASHRRIGVSDHEEDIENLEQNRLNAKKSQTHMFDA